MPRDLNRPVPTGHAVPLRATAMGALMLAGFGISAAAGWPGQLSYDSVIQLAEGRRGIYGNWHPPVMSWLLGLGDGIRRGSGLYVLFQAGLLFTGLWLLAGRPKNWAGPTIAVLLLTTPQLLLYPAIVWKDVLFAGAMLAGFGGLAVVGRYWMWPAARTAGLGIALLGMVLAVLARQNGFLIVPFAAGALAVIAAKSASGEGAGRRGSAFAGAGLLLFAAVTILGYQLLAARVAPASEDGPAGQLQFLQAYDLIGALRSEPHRHLPILARRAPQLLQHLRREGVRLYSARSSDTLAASGPLLDAIWDADRRVVGAQWRTLFLDQPWLYAQVRWRVFDWVFRTPQLSACVPYYVGVDGPPALMQSLGLERRFDRWDQLLSTSAARFDGTPVLSHITWAVLAVATILVLLRRRAAEDWAVIGLLAAALAYAASFFVISIACDYRYLYGLDVAAMAGLLYAAGNWQDLRIWEKQRWRSRDAGVSGEPASP